MAVAFASAPIAGQNFGARSRASARNLQVGGAHQRGNHADADSAVSVRVALRIFTTEEAVVMVGAQMLMIASWNFCANGIIFCCSSMFQALGNTWPTIASSAIRLTIFVFPAWWLSTQPGFQLVHVWYVSLASMFIQAVISYTLLRREFARKLAPAH